MNPLKLVKHTLVDSLDERLRGWTRAQLWLALAGLAGADVLTSVFDWIPLVDDVIVGGLAIKIAGELLRRRKTPTT